MRTPPLPHVSLRVRFASGIAAMLVPLVLFVLVDHFYVLPRLLESVDELAGETVDELTPVMRLQNLILKAAMPVNDYLIHGNPAERDNFLQSGREVDQAFEKAFAVPYGLAEERSLVQSVWDEWQQIRTLGEALLALPHPVGDPVAARQMEGFDDHLDRAVDHLDRVRDLANQEIEEELAASQAVRRTVELFTLGIFGLAFAIVIVASVALARSTLAPIQALTRGAVRLGGGDLAYRVEMNRRDEIGQLARAFNNMAQALQTHLAERQRSEDALREERQLFVGGTTVVFKWKPEEGWPVEYVSPNVRNQFGYAPEALVCDEFRYATIVHPDDLARVVEEVKAYTRAGVPCFEQEYRIARADGEYRWLYDFTVPVRDEHGKITRYHGYVLDITERKRAEKALAEQSRLLEAFFANTLTCIALLDRDFNFIRVNEAYARADERRVADFPGHKHFEFYPSEARAMFEQAVATKKPLRASARPFVYASHPERGTTYWDWTLEPIPDDTGGVEVLIFTLNNVTERQRAEAERARLIAILEATPDFVATADPSGNVLYYNHAARSMLGLGEEEDISGIRIPDTHPAWANEIIRNEAIPTAIRAGFWMGETALLSRDGREIPVSQVTLAHKAPDGTVDFFSTIARDITERKRAEQERARLLQETHQRAGELEALAEVASALRAARTVEEMLPLLVRKAAEAVGGAAGSIFLVEPKTGDLVSRGWLAAGDGWRFTSDASLTLRHRPGQGITGQVAATGQVYITRDMPHDPVAVFLPGEVERLRSIHGGISLPLRTQERIVGVLHIWRREDRGFADAEVRLLTSIAEMAGNALHRAALHEQTERDAVELALAYDATIEGWSKALELRDRETEGHTLRVTDMTLRLACATGVGEDERVHVRRGALLHDIGKIGVPDHILLKPDSLTDDEWAIMRRHPQYAYDMLLPIAYLRPALDIPYCHHEKWDGAGYPRGLKGEQIPLAARIFAVADVWDALSNDRPYRAAWPEDKVIEYIQAASGSHFDPKVVEAFLNVRTGE